MLPRTPDGVERRHDDHRLNAWSLHGRCKAYAKHGSRRTVLWSRHGEACCFGIDGTPLEARQEKKFDGFGTRIQHHISRLHVHILYTGKPFGTTIVTLNMRPWLH